MTQRDQSKCSGECDRGWRRHCEQDHVSDNASPARKVDTVRGILLEDRDGVKRDGSSRRVRGREQRQVVEWTEETPKEKEAAGDEE